MKALSQQAEALGPPPSSSSGGPGDLHQVGLSCFKSFSSVNLPKAHVHDVCLHSHNALGRISSLTREPLLSYGPL